MSMKNKLLVLVGGIGIVIGAYASYLHRLDQSIEALEKINKQFEKEHKKANHL